MTFAPGSKTS